MITPQHVNSFEHFYLNNGPFESKKEAFEVWLLDHPEAMDNYKDFRSCYNWMVNLLRRQSPELARPYTRSEDRHPVVYDKIDRVDAEMIEANDSLKKQAQFHKDKNRIAEKAYRSHAREFNAAQALNEAIERAIEKLPECLLDYQVRTGPYQSDTPVIVAQLSDLHLNELINMGDVNTFDFKVASQRLQKYVEMLKLQAETFGAERVVFAFGGDLVNSDRRIDEKLAEATNRADAMVIAGELLFEMIMDVRADYFVDVLAVVGNEGRVGEKQSFAKKAAKYNYDTGVLKIVRSLCEKACPVDKGLRWYLHESGINERTFEIKGKTFLILHGNQGGVAGGSQKTVQAAIGKYAMTRDIKIDKVLAGHIHSSIAGDYFSRNASLAGSNDYSDSLQFASKAAQNLHVVTDDSIFSLVVDLQDASGFEGYPIEHLLELYGCTTYDGQTLGQDADESHIYIC